MNLIKYFIILIVLLSLHACNNQNFYQNEVRKFCDTLILAQDSIQRHIPAGKLNYSTFKIIQSKLAKNGRYKDIFSLFNANSIPIADNIAGFELSFNHCKEIFIERKYNLRKTNDMSIRLRLTYFDGVYAVFVDGHNVFILNNKTKLIICLKTASVDNYKPFGLLKIYYLNDQLFPIFALEQGHPDTHKGLEDYLLYRY